MMLRSSRLAGPWWPCVAGEWVDTLTWLVVPCSESDLFWESHGLCGRSVLLLLLYVHVQRLAWYMEKTGTVLTQVIVLHNWKNQHTILVVDQIPAFSMLLDLFHVALCRAGHVIVVGQRSVQLCLNASDGCCRKIWTRWSKTCSWKSDAESSSGTNSSMKNLLYNRWFGGGELGCNQRHDTRNRGEKRPRSACTTKAGLCRYVDLKWYLKTKDW